MNLTAISDQLKAEVAALANRVYGSAELENAAANPARVTKPSAFVVWVEDVPLDQTTVPGQAARFREDFAVVVVVDNTTDLTGEAGVGRVEALAEDIKTALIGWAPSASHLPTFYAGSSHLRMDPSALFHRFDFSAVVPGGSIFTYNVEFRVRLLAGVTISSVYTLFASKVESVLGASTRLTSDYLIDREAIPESTTRYQLIEPPAVISEGSDANNANTELAIRLSVHRHLAPGDSERTYTETTMVTHLTSFLARSFWRDNTKIRDVLEGPELGLGADLARG